MPGEKGTDFLTGIDQSGSAVRVLTNSLAANDVAMVYGAYSESRKDLLEGGVELHELKPTPGDKVESSFFGSSGASLHTKALTADGRLAFVGRYNLDPRSTSLNCEQGIFVDSPQMGKEMHDRSPGASAGRRFQAWIARVLPIDSQL